MTLIVPGFHVEVGSPATIRISSDYIADGCSFVALTHSIDEQDRYVSGFHITLRLRPDLMVDDLCDSEYGEYLVLPLRAISGIFVH